MEPPPPVVWAGEHGFDADPFPLVVTLQVTVVVVEPVVMTLVEAVVVVPPLGLPPEGGDEDPASWTTYDVDEYCCALISMKFEA